MNAQLFFFFFQCLLLVLFLTSTMPWICFWVQNRNKVSSGPSLSIPLPAIPCRGHIWAPLLHPGEPTGEPSRVALLAITLGQAAGTQAPCQHHPWASWCWKTRQNWAWAREEMLGVMSCPETESRCNQKADAGLGSSLDLWKNHTSIYNNLCTISLFYNLN